MDITGLRQQFETVEREPNERNIVRFLIGDANNRLDTLSSLAAAKNCRTVREVLPRSSGKSSTAYLFAKENVPVGLTKSRRDDFLDGSSAARSWIVGLLGSVMYRDEGLALSRIGRNLERADMTTHHRRAFDRPVSG